MLPALVLLLVYNLCCTHAISFHPGQRDGIIGHDPLLELVKRMDAKDEEIKELREIQKLHEADIIKLMIQIDAHDVNINEVHKTLKKKDNVITEMDQSKKRQDKTLNELQHSLAELQFENVQLRKLYPKCARRIQSLQAVIQNYMQINKNSQTVRLEKISHYVKDEANPIDDHVESGFNKFTSAIAVSHNPRDVIGRSQKRRHAGTDLVAFFATLKNNAVNLGQGQNLRFDHVITNIGSAYNPHAGACFAPVSGTYVFMSNLMTYIGHNCDIQVVRNGNMVCKLFVAGKAVLQYEESVGGSFVLYLEKGDLVALHNAGAGGYLTGDHYSFFSGFLLKQNGT